MKNNSGMFLPSNSTLTKLTRKQLFSQDLFNQIGCPWWCHSWSKQNTPSFLLSKYNYNDFYAPHFDYAMFTALVWLYKKPKPFKGGNLIFSDYAITIECRSNCGVIFFGTQKHEVTPVEGSGRYTLSMFTQCLDPDLK